MAAELEKPRRETSETVDLRQQTYDLLHLVRLPSVDEKEALRARGKVFLPVAVKSYAQVVAEYPEHFWEGELRHANRRLGLNHYMPPVTMLVGLNPEALVLPHSFNKSQADQLIMIDEYSQTLQARFPDARAVMLPATGYAQADRAYKEITGEVLFGNFFAQALDMTTISGAAVVGRRDPSYRLCELDWIASLGNPYVTAVPAVVFIGNK